MSALIGWILIAGVWWWGWLWFKANTHHLVSPNVEEKVAKERKLAYLNHELREFETGSWEKEYWEEVKKYREGT